MEKFIRIPMNCLHFLGHDLNGRTGNLVRFGFQASSLVTIITALCALLCYTISNKNDLNLATESVSISLTNFLTVIKIITFWCQKQEFIDLITNMVSIMKSGKNQEEKIIQKANNLSNLLVRSYFIASGLTGVYFFVTPLLKFLYCYIMNQEFIRELPMKMEFPFDYTKSPGYELAVIYTAGVTIFVILYAVSVDGMFISFTLNLCAHFEILQVRIQKRDFCEENFQENLRNFVIYHNNVLMMSKRLCNIYHPIVFAQFLISSLQICVIAYQLVLNLGNMLVITYLSFISAILLQLFIYCYGGENIKSESKKLGMAIYSSHWSGLPAKQQTAFIVMMRKAQVPVIVRGGFYIASLENYMMILRASGSYITLLQSMEMQ